MSDSGAQQPESVEQVQVKTEELRAENDRLVAECRAQGVQFNPLSMVQMRLEVLIEFLLGDEGRARYELQFAQKLNEQLREVPAQVARAKLTQGVNGQNPLLRPGGQGGS